MLHSILVRIFNRAAAGQLAWDRAAQHKAYGCSRLYRYSAAPAKPWIGERSVGCMQCS